MTNLVLMEFNLNRSPVSNSAKSTHASSKCQKVSFGLKKYLLVAGFHIILVHISMLFNLRNLYNLIYHINLENISNTGVIT